MSQQRRGSPTSMTLLAQSAQRALDAALTSPTGGILVRVYCPTDIVQPSRRGEQILARFRKLSPDYQVLRIDIMSDYELWITRHQG